MKTQILIPVFIVVLAFTCRTVHASGVIYSAKSNPDQAVSVPASSATVSYFDTGTLVSGINNSATTPNNEFTLHTIAPAVTPEPSSLILTGLGLMGLLVYRRCRKNQSKANA